FLQSQKYYVENKDKYNSNNGWFEQENKNLIIPNVFKLWADIVRNNLPNLNTFKSSFSKSTNIL
ncbi:MAG: hypothetical protein ACQBVK_02920, partial [Candidatus Phytoplasma sp. TWB_XP]